VVYRTPSTGGAPVEVFNGIVMNVQRVGDKDRATALVTVLDPMVWWAARFVRDSTGNFSPPAYTSPISGPTLLQQFVQGSIDFEGPLGLDMTGTFDAYPTASDLRMELSNWPMRLSDMAALLTQTGEMDIVIDPVVGDPENMGKLNAYAEAGSDLSAHLDYATGDHSIDGITVEDDLTTLCNKLYMFLGPKLGLWATDGGEPGLHWKGNITAGSGPLNPAPTSIYDASRALYGVWMDMQIYDSGYENSARQLFESLWLTEVILRLNGRQLCKVTPIASAPYQPFESYYLGDRIGLKTGIRLGVELDTTMRVYGFDVMPDNEGVEHMGELIVSADAE